MRIPSILISVMLVAFAGLTLGLAPAKADDAETIAAVNASSNALDAAFAARAIAKIRALMTPDHISVTPYYDGLQTVDDQIASLPELDYGETIVGTPSVVLLAPDVALRTFVAEIAGSFKGTPLPAHAFVNETLVKRDGKWIERFFQITTLKE